MCVNYGGRAEIADAMMEIAQDVKDRKLKPSAITEKKIKRYLYEPTLPDVDLFLRTSGEQRTSNFLLWQSAYAEMVFMYYTRIERIISLLIKWVETLISPSLKRVNSLKFSRKRSAFLPS